MFTARPRRGQRGQLLRDVERTAAVGVEDLGRHALGEHVDGGRQRVRRRVAVDVDEAGRDEQPARVDLLARPCPADRSPIATMCPLRMPTSALKRGVPLPSITVP